MKHDAKSDPALPSPRLSFDLELRPPGAEPASVGRALAPLISHYSVELLENTERLKSLANSAREARDYRAEALLLVKISELACAVLKLARGEPGEDERLGIRGQGDLPDFSKLFPEAQAKLAEFTDVLEKKWGARWLEHLCPRDR